MTLQSHKLSEQENGGSVVCLNNLLKCQRTGSLRIQMQSNDSFEDDEERLFVKEYPLCAILPITCCIYYIIQYTSTLQRPLQTTTNTACFIYKINSNIEKPGVRILQIN